MRKLLFVISTLFLLCTSALLEAEEFPADKRQDGLGDSEQKSFIDVNGFIEIRLGRRIQNDPYERDSSIGEARLQFETEKQIHRFTLNLVADVIFDPLTDIHDIDLDTGEGAIDLRQANILFSPLSYVDVKIGRQILTWGTGDLVFINDLFAKDWNSFLLGRDNEYLKAPTDAIKTSLFFNKLNMDIVYTPRFGADRYIDGTSNSFFDRSANTFRGRNKPLIVDRPDNWFDDDELALRLYSAIGAHEAALYYYHGYWKSPAGQNDITGVATFPDLEVFGTSLRGPIAQGIGNIEIGYYESDGSAATNALNRNSEFRFLLGYEQELATELTAAFQYNLERKLDYNKYINSLPSEAIQDDENRHIVTLRLTKLLMQQNLRLMLFNFYSTSDKDGHVRLNTSYKMSDFIKIEGGWNHFYGAKPHTFFGQFENNSNVYISIRYEF